MFAIITSIVGKNSIDETIMPKRIVISVLAATKLQERWQVTDGVRWLLAVDRWPKRTLAVDSREPLAVKR